MAKKEICKICGKEIIGTVVYGDGGWMNCVTCYNLELEKKMPVSDKRLDELIDICTHTPAPEKEFFEEAGFAFKELKIHRMQRKKRDLMIRKAQLLKQNKALLEKKKEGEK